MENQTIYIAGPGHSGSTLLDMLLGGHEKISALGEIHRFYLSLHKSSRPHCCDCGQPVLECEFWRAVIKRLEEQTGMSSKEILDCFYTTVPANLRIPDDNMEPPLPRCYSLDLARVIAGVAPFWLYRFASYLHPGVRQYRRIARNSHILFDAVRDVAKTPIIVDSTKNPIRLRTLYAERPRQMKIVYVIRDGRAVTHSRLRRHDVSMADAAKVWVAEHRKQRIVQRDIADSKIFKVRYEALCSNPELELSRLCNFLGVEFAPNILLFRQSVRHAVGGNPMRFDNANRKIELREHWRNELSEKQLEEFDRVGGKLNRSLGYACREGSSAP